MPVFNFNGMKYREASAHQKEWGAKIIQELNLRGDESILDLGCGDGVLTGGLAERAGRGRVVGIDSSESMIETAQAIKKNNLRFLVMDIDEIDFVDEFDVIFSNAALHWVKNHERLLDNCRRALKEDGSIRFNFAGDGNCRTFNATVRQLMKDKRFAESFRDFDWPWYMPRIDEYRALVRGEKFREINIWEENADRFFADEEEMTKWIDQPSLVPFLKYCAEELKTDFRNEVVREMIARTKQADGRCLEAFLRINVFAKK